MDLTRNMTEPASTGAASVAGYKLILAALPIGASLIAFWLGLRFVPLRDGHEREDIINRVMACLVSAFILGVTLLVLMTHHWPWIFDAGAQLADLALLPRPAGFFVITMCVLTLASIPGPWIVAAIFVWLRRQEGKALPDVVHDAINDIKGAHHDH